MLEINPLTNDQIFLKKIAENTGSDYETGDVSEINPLTIDQILLKEIAANTAGQSGDITELEGKVADNTAAIEATQDMISDAYDSTHTYNVGDYCIYENVIYKCKTASTTGTWDSSKWAAVTVAEELGELTDKVDRGSVSVVGDGVKTNQQALHELFSLVDFTKITPYTVFWSHQGPTSYYYHLINSFSSSRLMFVTVDNPLFVRFQSALALLDNHLIVDDLTDGTSDDRSSNVLDNGWIYTIVY